MPEFIWVYKLLQNCWGGQWVLMSFDRGSELCGWLRRAGWKLSNTNKSKAKIYIDTQQTLGKWQHMQTDSHKVIFSFFYLCPRQVKSIHRACCKHCKELFHTLKAWRTSPLQRQSLYSLAMIIGWNMLNWTSPTSTEEHVAFPSFWPKIPCENMWKQGNRKNHGRLPNLCAKWRIEITTSQSLASQAARTAFKCSSPFTPQPFHSGLSSWKRCAVN